MIRRAAQLYAAMPLRTLAAVALVAFAVSAILAFSRPIVMFVDGERVDSDVAPVTTASARVYVPLRSVADALGAQIEADGKNGAIGVVLGSRSLQLREGELRAKLNGTPFTLKRAPFVVRGRLMVQLDAIARALGVRAKYDARDARVEVTTPGVGQAP